MSCVSSTPKQGWPAVTSTTCDGMLSGYASPWRVGVPDERTPLILHTPGHVDGDLQIGDWDGQMFFNREGIPQRKVARWTYIPELP